jgi:flavin reductase (DIM6/NTAB) family NADH-FMN oxidoreductase RutF
MSVEKFKKIDSVDIEKIVDLWDKHWLLLTAGNFAAGVYNTMTVAWGSFGVMWGKPFAQVVVRPTRFTFDFMQNYDSFTLCAFPHEYKKALSLLGSRSGRDGDKIAESGLTPAPAAHVASPVFTEASLVIECRKMYWQDFDPQYFIDEEIDSKYPRKDYHRIYYGEILAMSDLNF